MSFIEPTCDSTVITCDTVLMTADGFAPKGPHVVIVGTDESNNTELSMTEPSKIELSMDATLIEMGVEML